VVVVRDEQGDVNAFVNVCRHRGAEVVREDCGHRMSLQCPYHAWTYGLDGRLRRAPRAERNPDSDLTGLDLHRLRVELCGPLVFVNPDPEALPFAEVYDPWPALLAQTGIDLAELRTRAVRRFEVAANWKLLAQNNVECYHCPTNHPSLAKVQDVEADLWFEGHETFQRYGTHARPEAYGRSGSDGYYRIEEGERASAVLNHLFPNFFCAVMPGDGIVTLSVALPLAVDRSVYLRQYCFAESVPDETVRDACDFFDLVYREDIGLCETVQRGLSTGYYTQGSLLLPQSEPGVSHQERLVFRAMTG
jgi:choline monooxygenase